MAELLPDIFTEPHKLSGMPTDSPLLVALSGGADSSALLYYLYTLQKKYRFPLYAAHVNHNIRNEIGEGGISEADRDEQFCRTMCEKLNVELFVAKIDVPALAKESGKSLETAARDARYSFFAHIMNQEAINILVTAHNADDNLETQIFNLARGCGTEGICGIPRTRSFDKVDGGIIIRPLLSAAKKEIFAYCEEVGIEYVTDSTNLEDDCTRNIIRHRIIPELTDLFNSPQRSALRLSSAAAEDNEFIRSQAQEFLSGCNGEIKLEKLNSLHPAVAKRVIMLAFSRTSSACLEQVHIDGILTLCKKQIIGQSISLPQKNRARITNGCLTFEHDLTPIAPPPFDIKLCMGLNIIPDNVFAVFVGTNAPDEYITDLSNGNIYKLYTSASLKNVKIEMLRARNRHEGDLIRDGGMSKKVKKLLCDKKIAAEDRYHLPIIWEGEELIYVPKCALADRIKSRGTDPDFMISIYKKDTFGGSENDTGR